MRLSFNINYGRPLYNGYEAMAFVSALCNKFQLFVSDPQGFKIGIDAAPRECNVENLVRSWDVNNRETTKGLILSMKKTVDRPAIMIGDMDSTIFAAPDRYNVLPYQRAVAWWTYRMNEVSIKGGVHNIRTAVLPEVKILKRKQGGPLLLTVALSEGIAHLLLECDIFYVIRNGQKEIGLVSSDVLMPQLSSLLKPYECAGLKMAYLSGDDAKKAVDVLRSVSLEPADAFEIMPPGSFLDFDPMEDAGPVDPPVYIVRSISSTLLADRDFSAHVEKGMSLKEKGDHKSALKEFEAAVRAKPDAAGAHFYTALMLQKLGRIDEAIDEYRIEARIDPTNAMVFNNLGNMLLEKGSLNEAADIFRKTIELDGNFYMANYNLGLALGRQGDFDGALPYVRKALEASPQYFPAHNLYILLLRERGSPADIIQECKLILQMLPGDIRCHLYMGEALFKNGDRDGALKELNIAVTMDSKEAVVHYETAVAMNGCANAAGAIEEARKASVLEPGNKTYRDFYRLLSAKNEELNNLIAGYKEWEKTKNNK